MPAIQIDGLPQHDGPTRSVEVDGAFDTRTYRLKD